jgi:hypothetical protein
MAFVPKGFFGRLMIRLLAFPLAARVYWRTGMLAQMGQYVAFPTFLFNPPRAFFSFLSN